MSKCTRHHLFSYGGLLEAVKIKFISVLLRSIYVLGKLKAGKNHFLSIRTSVYLVLSAGLSISQFFYISLRDVDNSRKPGKLPGCERDFSSCKALHVLLSPKCFSMLPEDCYLFISFVYTFTAVLPEVKVLYVNILFSHS